MALAWREDHAYFDAMLPTLRQLQYLKLLAEHASFSRAADAASVSQPALSAGIQELERVLGAPVVERTRGAVQLTAVGAEAVSRAEDVLARTEDLVEAARNAVIASSGNLASITSGPESGMNTTQSGLVRLDNVY